jgi:hypothetical protein
MRRLILFLALAALALPSLAFGKGPTAATMEGPGGGSITFSGGEASGSLGQLTEQSGWFNAAFEPGGGAQAPAGRPEGDLGPKYTVTYGVPGPNNDTFTIVQDLYPYASPGPVAYMAPGQPLYDMKTHGGWFQAGPELKQTLVAAGLPETLAGRSSDDTSFPTTTVSLLAFALLLVGATALLLRRRARPAAA